MENINIILDEVSKLYQLDIDRGKFNQVGRNYGLIHYDFHQYNFFVAMEE